MNVFVGLMLVGTATDYAVYMLERYDESPEDFPMNAQETGRAVVLAALMSIVGFASFAISHYPGRALDRPGVGGRNRAELPRVDHAPAGAAVDGLLPPRQGVDAGRGGAGVHVVPSREVAAAAHAPGRRGAQRRMASCPARRTQVRLGVVATGYPDRLSPIALPPAARTTLRSGATARATPRAFPRLRSALRPAPECDRPCARSRSGGRSAPPSFPALSSLKRWKTSNSARASSAAVGSSRISTCASRMYARPIAIFCHSPPESSTPVWKRLPSHLIVAVRKPAR